MKKGAFFTIDALIAISIALIFMTFIFSNLNQAKPLPADQTTFARDSMKVLHQTGSLKDITKIQNYLDSLPEQLCGSVKIYDESISLQTNTTRTGCTSSTYKSVSWKSFIDNDIMLARGEFWLK